MPSINGSGTLKKKSKRMRVKKERELDNNFDIGTLKSINGGKSASVVLKKDGSTVICRMPKGIRIRYRVKDEVKVHKDTFELIGKLNVEKEDIDYDSAHEENEQTVDIKQYNKEIKKVRSVVERNRNRGDTKNTRHENDMSEESENSDEDNKNSDEDNKNSDEDNKNSDEDNKNSDEDNKNSDEKLKKTILETHNIANDDFF
jgi:hypothetical protein